MLWLATHCATVILPIMSKPASVKIVQNVDTDSPSYPVKKHLFTIVLMKLIGITKQADQASGG